MRRIILAFLTLTLTACGRPTDDAPVLTDEPDPGSGTAALDREAPAANAAGANRDESAPTVLFVGTSLTAGYGVGAEQAYPGVLQQMIDSAGLPYRVVNAGISGVESPTRSAVIPSVVPRGLLPSAFALNQSLTQTSQVVGPAVAGLLMARFGVGVVYWISAIAVGLASLALAKLEPQRPEGATGRVSLRATAEGWR